MKQLMLMQNTNDFKSFKCKAKLLENTEADNAYRISKNAAIALRLNYLSNLWRSLKMPLINCKVGLKLTWTKYCVLSEAGNDNNNSDDEIILTTKIKIICRCCNFISKGQ